MNATRETLERYLKVWVGDDRSLDAVLWAAATDGGAIKTALNAAIDEVAAEYEKEMEEAWNDATERTNR